MRHAYIEAGRSASGGQVRRAAHTTALVALALLAAACPGRDAAPDEYVPLVTFDTARARIMTAADTFEVAVEIAEREDQRSYGLMERPSLPDDRGMIFLYGQEQPPDAGFWMYRTRIPLDIAFLDRDGAIVNIRAMEPCPHADPRGCPTYAPGVGYFSALEVNRGWFTEHGVGIGDRVVIDR
jgi:uncharacterized protein